MINVHIRHKVADYERWKEVFDAFIDVRRAGGEISYRIFRPLDDPDNQLLLFEWSDEESVKSFLDSAPLRDAMQSAGVLEPPVLEQLLALGEVGQEEALVERPAGNRLRHV